MHYTSPPSRGEFRADIVSYDRNQSCLVSSLRFRATASHNGTTVMCTRRERSSNQSLLLHVMSSEWFSGVIKKKTLFLHCILKIINACQACFYGRWKIWFVECLCYNVTLCTQVETDIHLHHLILLLIMPSECVLSCYHESAELVCACCCSYIGCVPN